MIEEKLGTCLWYIYQEMYESEYNRGYNIQYDSSKEEFKFDTKQFGYGHYVTQKLWETYDEGREYMISFPNKDEFLYYTMDIPAVREIIEETEQEILC